MTEIELISNNFELVNKEKKDKRIFNIPEGITVLIFADVVNKQTIFYLKRLLKFKIVCLVITPNPICDLMLKHDLVYWVVVKELWYIHTLFLNPFDIKYVYGFGEKGKLLAEIFSKFTGMNIDVFNIGDIKHIVNSANSKKILIKTLDGIGDLLMLIPTIKTYWSRGYLVDLIVWEGREQVVKNLPYVNKVYSQKEKINLSQYKKFIDISYKLSNYSKDICRKHRVLTTANLCGLQDNELITKTPEIFVKDNEIENVKSKFRFSNIVLGLESNDERRSVPLEKRQEFIDKIFEITRSIPTVVGSKKVEYKNCYNLSGLISIRELFTIIYLARDVITTDTSLLHIGTAFNKNVIFMPSTVPNMWREYNTTKTIIPLVECYPCTENTKCKTMECLKNIDYEKIERFLKE